MSSLIGRAKFLLVFIVFFQIASLSPVFSQTCLTDSLFSSVKADEQTDQGVFASSSKWLPGQKLRVKFLDGDPGVIARVKRYAETWETHANIDFVFVEGGEAEIRISFKYNGSWSLVGKKSLTYSSNGNVGVSNNSGASMNFGWLDQRSSDTEVRRVTLHEFGHALGLLHEHQNAGRAFEWNLPVVMNHYMTELGWSREDVERYVIKRYGDGTEYSNRAYDPQSIMHYPVPANFTKNGRGVGNNTVLSDGDKALIREMYPFTADTAGKIADVKFNNIDIEHNIYQNGVKGMKMKVDFSIKNGYQQEHKLIVYFHDNRGVALKDKNGKFHTVEGSVATSRLFTPNFKASRFGSYTLFMPYSELHMPCGDFRLRFNISIRKNKAEIAQSGAQYFTLHDPCSNAKTATGENTAARNYFRLYFTNTCEEKISILIHFKDLDGNWISDGWYAALPGKSIYVKNSRNRIFYFHAKSPESTWKGTHKFSFKDKVYEFRERKVTNETWGAFTTTLTCKD